MRIYSKRERIGAALAAAGVFLPLAILVTHMAVTDPSARTWSLFLALAGLWAGVLLFAKVALSPAKS